MVKKVKKSRGTKTPRRSVPGLRDGRPQNEKAELDPGEGEERLPMPTANYSATEETWHHWVGRHSTTPSSVARRSIRRS